MKYIKQQIGPALKAMLHPFRIPRSERGSFWYAVIVVSLISAIIVAFAVTVLQDYGIIMFCCMPFFMGWAAIHIYTYHEKKSNRRMGLMAFCTMFATCMLLLLSGVEGMLCILMVSPLVFGVVVLGAIIGNLTRKWRKNNRYLSSMALMLPLLMGIESRVATDGDMIKVSTVAIIDASPEKVWSQVVEFPEIPEPEDWFFKTGIAYPISAHIEGQGVGAVRYCSFTTGSFVEPITAWEAPYRLAFDVKERPEPLKHFIPHRKVPANMYQYFVSTRGEFLLEELENGKTRLTGTTWYYHKIRPTIYWSWWSELIIHKIHERVLGHIKINAEQSTI